MWPWVKSPFNMNKFDNRFKAQEKLLHEQPDMIKDQQKLIEEMKFQQSQVAFKEQIALFEQIKAKQVWCNFLMLFYVLNYYIFCCLKLELENMQKMQYKQEKRLLKQQSNIQKSLKKNS